MRFDSAEWYSYGTNSAAATCSFALTAATRNFLIETITTYTDKAASVVTIQASGTTLFQMTLGSASTVSHLTGLKIETGSESTLSANISNGTADCSLALTGRIRYK